MPFSALPVLRKIAAATTLLVNILRHRPDVPAVPTGRPGLWRQQCAPFRRAVLRQPKRRIHGLPRQSTRNRRSSLRCSNPSCSVASCGKGGGSRGTGSESSASSTPDIPSRQHRQRQGRLRRQRPRPLTQVEARPRRQQDPTPSRRLRHQNSEDDAANQAAPEHPRPRWPRSSSTTPPIQLLAEAGAYNIAPTPPPAPDTTSAIGALLDSSAPSPSPRVAGRINNLLDSPTPTPDPSTPTAAVSALLDAPDTPTPSFTPTQLQQMLVPQGSPVIPTAYQGLAG